MNATFSCDRSGASAPDLSLYSACVATTLSEKSGKSWKQLEIVLILQYRKKNNV